MQIFNLNSIFPLAIAQHCQPRERHANPGHYFEYSRLVSFRISFLFFGIRVSVVFLVKDKNCGFYWLSGVHLRPFQDTVCLRCAVNAIARLNPMGLKAFDVHCNIVGLSVSDDVSVCVIRKSK